MMLVGTWIFYRIELESMALLKLSPGQTHEHFGIDVNTLELNIKIL